ncbi:sugar phosphate nucleotidyltransferase [Paenibacillus daejeonensis]|uniref:sugar phosphate nucleotidyltransferase n=1 Tax=Paenibacillus daejeonensis TaxID=135193 RepID=UPI0003649B08|nr:sugar phosphate nucleotidyltransferase [Paenibacillus daejeonensis]
MKLILLSGGSGKRLWPLSNDARSKQFLRMLEGPEGRKESMVERVWRQLGESGIRSSAYIATGQAQEELLRAHVGPEVPLIVEPSRRDTFPAIALSAVYLYSILGVSLDETVAVLPVDPYVEDGFFRRVTELEEVIARTGCDMALMGVAPTYPSAKYGYIVPEPGHADDPVQSPRGELAPTGVEASEEEARSGQLSGVGAIAHSRRVRRFTEKPDEAAAAGLIAEGALWNCGVFAFRLGYLIQLLIDRGLPIHYDGMLQQYDRLKKTSFDYEVVEQAAHIEVLRYDGYWKDLGTWNTLTEEMKSPLLGEGRMTEDCVDTHVLNELGIPIAVLGLSGIVVAASPDGILVSDKAASPRIKEVMQHDDRRPMYEERRWGHYLVLDQVRHDDGTSAITKRVCLEAGCNFSYHFHTDRSEVWTVLSGRGEMILDGATRLLQAGDVAVIPARAVHTLMAHTDMQLIEVQRGVRLVEEDIVRLGTQWSSITQF